MAPPKLSDTLAKYQSALNRSKRWRADDYDDTWKRMRDLYKGKHWESGGNSDQLVLNMAFATINIIGPSVAVSNPKFSVSARRAESEAQAMFTAEVVNYLWRTWKYQIEFRKAVNDWLIFGHGWMKCGYKFVQEPKVVSADPPSTDVGDEGVQDREPVEGNVESEMEVMDDRPFVERISVFDMFVDPDCHGLGDMSWIAQRVRRPINDARVDERYTNATVRKNLQPSMGSRFDGGEQTHEASDNLSPTGAKDKGFIDIIEWYDMRRKYMCVFADGNHDGFLINPKPWPYSFGQPFLFLPNYEIPDEFYPIGELEMIEPPQLELNETRTQMMNHRKRYARKYLYMEDALDEAGIAALESDEDNSMVPVNAGQDINRVIIPMPAVGTPPDFYNQSQMIEDDIDKVSGVSDYMRGQQPNIRRTATEAAMIQDAANSRAQDKKDRIENFLSIVGERLIQLLQQYMTGEQVVRVVGTGAIPVWIKYDRDYIQGEFDFDVEAGSTQPQNETFRRQSAMQMVDAMAPFAQAGVIDMAALAKYVLQQGFGVKDPDSLINAAGPAPGMPPEGAVPPGQGPPPGQGAPPPGAQQQGALPPGAPPGAPMPPGGPPPSPMAGPPGGAPGMPQLPPEVLQQLQAFLAQIPPQAQQRFTAELAQIPPEKRVAFIMAVLAQFAQQQGQQPAGPPPGAAPVGGPPPGAQLQPQM